MNSKSKCYCDSNNTSERDCLPLTANSRARGAGNEAGLGLGLDPTTATDGGMFSAPVGAIAGDGAAMRMRADVSTVRLGQSSLVVTKAQATRSQPQHIHQRHQLVRWASAWAARPSS